MVLQQALAAKSAMVITEYFDAIFTSHLGLCVAHFYHTQIIEPKVSGGYEAHNGLRTTAWFFAVLIYSVIPLHHHSLSSEIGWK